MTTTFRLKFTNVENTIFNQKTLTINEDYMDNDKDKMQLRKLLIKQFLNEYVWKKGDQYAYEFSLQGKTINVQIGIRIRPPK